MFGRGAIVTDPQGAAFALWHGSFGDPADEPPTPAGAWHWNELLTTDAEAALGFYERVFGFAHESRPMPSGNGEARAPRTTCSRMRRACRAPASSGRPIRAAVPMWMQYVAVADCDETAARAAGLGGTVLMAPTDMPGAGRFAVIGDTAGTAVAVLQAQSR